MGMKKLNGGLLVLALGLSACGSNDVQVQGKVTQGPVSGAVIFADRQDAGTRSTKDADEVSTITGPTGNFSITVAADYGNYLFVSQGGTDTITGKPALQMFAPPGATNVTPLTSLVALAPANLQAALKSKIEATGVKFDADISTNATPAALLLAKSVESAIETLGKSIDPAGTKLDTAQLQEIQQQTMAAIATSAAAQANLLSSATLVNAINTGVTNAIPSIVAENPGITVTNVATVATAASNMVTTVATGMGNATGTFSTTTTVTETAQFSASTLNTINNAVQTNSDTAANAVVVIPTPPTVVAGSSSLTGVAIAGPVSVVFSRGMNPATVTSATFQINGVTGTVAYNSSTKTATFTPSAPLEFATTYTVTLSAAILDLNGLALVPATLTFTTVPRPLTGSTGSGGTGANF